MFIKRSVFTVFIFILLFTTHAEKQKDSVFTPSYVLKIMQRAADWQLNDWTTKGFKRAKWDWTNAAAYTGIMELAKISTDSGYMKFLVNIGDSLNWNTGPRRFHADDYCIAQTYANLYRIYKDKKMREPFEHLADSIIAQPHTESL